MATGQVLQSVLIDVEPNATTQHPPLNTDFLTEKRHKAAAERLSADEYFNFLYNNVDSSEQTLDSVEEYLENSKCVKVKGRLRAHVSFWKRIGGLTVYC